MEHEIDGWIGCEYCGQPEGEAIDLPVDLCFNLWWLIHQRMRSLYKQTEMTFLCRGLTHTRRSDSARGGVGGGVLRHVPVRHEIQFRKPKSTRCQNTAWMKGRFFYLGSNKLKSIRPKADSYLGSFIHARGQTNMKVLPQICNETKQTQPLYSVQCIQFHVTRCYVIIQKPPINETGFYNSGNVYSGSNFIFCHSDHEENSRNKFTLQSDPPGITAYMYLIGHRSDLLNQIQLFCQMILRFLSSALALRFLTQG